MNQGQNCEYNPHPLLMTTPIIKLTPKYLKNITLTELIDKFVDHHRIKRIVLPTLPPELQMQYYGNTLYNSLTFRLLLTTQSLFDQITIAFQISRAWHIFAIINSAIINLKKIESFNVELAHTGMKIAFAIEYDVKFYFALVDELNIINPVKLHKLQMYDIITTKCKDDLISLRNQGPTATTFGGVLANAMKFYCDDDILKYWAPLLSKNFNAYIKFIIDN